MANVTTSQKVDGFHGGCPSSPAPAIGSSYNALYRDDSGRVCCSECGAVDLVDRAQGKSLRLRRR